MCKLFKILRAGNFSKKEVCIFNHDEYVRIKLESPSKYRYLFIVYYPEFKLDDPSQEVPKYFCFCHNDHQFSETELYKKYPGRRLNFDEVLDYLSQGVSEEIVAPILFNLDQL